MNIDRALIILLLFTLAPAAAADVPPSQIHEVEHLLKFVAGSDCEIERNGDRHSGKEAAAHIQKKYNHFRDRIKSTEDFIEYSATKSTISGRYYMLSCSGETTIKTKEWLLNELHRYRSTNNKTD